MGYMSFSILVSSGYMPRSGIARLYGGFIPSFLRDPHTVLHSGCINLHSHQQCPLFSTPSAAFIVCKLFDDGHSGRCGVISHCSFNLHFSNDERCWAFFMCLLAIYMSFWRNIFLGLFPTFWLSCLYFWYWVVWAACIFWKLILCQLFPLLLFSRLLRVVFSLCL